MNYMVWVLSSASVLFLSLNQLNMLPLNSKILVNKMKRIWEYCVVVVTPKLHLQV